ncbi:hypothetical protein/3-hydroxybutyryl-CoA dehydratase [Nonlabens sp. Hel1_33_55]|uniref:MaoC family dehydratase n=1 Tax=Nonlabens sp. Hel1_33_55 TaxID=1336802 RepID=UPI000875B143|nr:MaoC family dehydratase [Nonlabens sp. Hel1_33_55]SCX94195.1 hypothetical protein/3-hydroxybutyryl-CoA dehydratase [Nonlabens sp. Hel1_33_55]
MNKIKVGDRAIDKRRFSSADVQNYADLSGDFNPIHFDEDYAKDTIFKKPIVHGPLVITLITTLFAKELPGPGSVYLSHDIKYLHPVFIDDEVTAILEVIEVTDKQHVIIKTSCYNAQEILLLEGIARLKKY